MTPDQIKRQRKIIESIIVRRQGFNDRAISRQKRAALALDRAKERLYELRNKCKHDFDREDEPNMMGRGTCRICGEDDY